MRQECDKQITDPNAPLGQLLMPAKVIECDGRADVDPPQYLPGDQRWLPVLQHACDFSTDVFESVSLNLLKNPNINSSLLFRADILYDSDFTERLEGYWSAEDRREAKARYAVDDGLFPSFFVRRTLVRRMIPRNPQLDKPIAQTCVFFQNRPHSNGVVKTILLYVPHANDANEVPWYHPRVRALAYLHSWDNTPSPFQQTGVISLHYRLFPHDTLPLLPRLVRTGQHLLTTLLKHGQGRIAGYTKRVHHDQLISQQRVQNTYTELKQDHAQRLCDVWVEKTDPTKHVFEDLGIAAFLIELWKDMYRLNDASSIVCNQQKDDRPPFPGFVDIGCGNGVLVDILLHYGYQGWGFDARRRKTWSVLPPTTQANLKEMILIPQPLFESHAHQDQTTAHANGALISKTHNTPWHNGIFPSNTFIISNHADELTPWTPLLASISNSPFLAIPCCSHNLSGLRFRAPSVFNNNSADALAPTFFAANVNKSKSIAIAVACADNAVFFDHEQPPGPESGDLNALNLKARSKQPSAYSSLCDWVAHLAARVGYKVEREVLRIPSTRNVGILGRGWVEGFRGVGLDERRTMVAEIASGEGADGEVWVERARGLMGEIGREGVH
ncbi:tRNA(Ser) Um(44) 2'-O-methyltransferase [Puttea exsequens]|nr:tRNA(Ser) Um(44) 2'-O-methyltransferase [Puttea exsequens]